jgi:hypothetical protein
MQYSRLFDYADCPPRETSTSTSIAVLVIALTASELLILGVCRIMSWYADVVFYSCHEVERSRETIAYSLQTSRYKRIGGSEECPICLVEFGTFLSWGCLHSIKWLILTFAVSSETGDSVSHGKASCAHVFHEECLSQWLSKQSSCPCCRKDMIITSGMFPWQREADAPFCLFVFWESFGRFIKSMLYQYSLCRQLDQRIIEN